MKLTAIDKAFGVGESAGQGKSMLIRKMLKVRPMDPAWSLRSRMDQNPMAWMIQVNGFLVDARFLKREIQEEALAGADPVHPRKAAALEGRRRSRRGRSGVRRWRNQSRNRNRPSRVAGASSRSRLRPGLH